MKISLLIVTHNLPAHCVSRLNPLRDKLYSLLKLWL